MGSLWSTSIEGCGEHMEECSNYANITESNMAILVNTTGIPCLRCVGSMGETGRDTVFLYKGTPIELTTPVSNMRVDDSGALMILDAARLIPDGSQISVVVDCAYPRINPAVFHLRATVYSNSKYFFLKSVEINLLHPQILFLQSYSLLS